MMTRRVTAGLAVAAVITAAVGTSACAQANAGDDGDKPLIVGIDLPLQGPSKDESNAVINAMKLYLEQVGGKAGRYRVEFKVYDDSTAAKGAWDDATCAKNAQEHVANIDQVAVMGTYNSGCAKIEVPVLNQDPTGPMLMVSHGNTNPGLTKKWDAGEPEKYYPTGKRNYARVITTDDYQGVAAAQFVARDLRAKRCYVLNDNQTYGQGVSKAFAAELAKNGVEIAGEQAWDAKQPNYAALFTAIKATSPDCVYLGGIFDNNGGQLVRDKVKILGDNDAVKLIVPDGFTGFPDFQQLPEAAGAYLTFAGLSTEQLRAAGGAAARFLDAYKAKYGADPVSNFALYGVQALQVILAAIERSDGSRRSVTDAVLTGSGITIPASTAILGKDIVVDPASGDVSVRDISVLVLKGGKEVLHKPWPLS